MSRAREFADLAGSADAGGLTGRNLIINGSMQIAQRATSVTSVSTYGIKTVDRFAFGQGGSPSSVYTLTQESDAPDGFEKSLKFNCTTADTSFTSSQQNNMEYRFERSDLQRLQHGTSGAKAITLSFWVKSNVTGNYAVWFYKNETQDRMTNKVYTINSADTWEHKTLVINGDTDADGAIASGSTYGMIIRWVLSSGSGFTSGTSPDGSWEDYSAANAYAGHAVNLASATGNTWQITGIQLEIGDKSTPFEHRSYADELRRCQRYFQKTGNVGASNEWFPGVATNAGYGPRNAWVLKNNGDRAWVQERFPVVMRSSPTLTLYPGRGDVTNSAGNITHYNGTTAVSWTYGPNGSCSGLSGYFQGISSDNGAGYSMQYTVDAEL
jgi:hypothetical protein